MSELTPAKSQPPAGLVADIRALIEDARRQTAVAVNMGLTLLYWRVGQRIHLDVLKGERAEYGKEILSTLSTELVPLYGRGSAHAALPAWCSLRKRSRTKKLSTH